MEYIAFCVLNGQTIRIKDAVRLLDEQPGAQFDFRCMECGRPVMPYPQKDGYTYFQHLKKNPTCGISDELTPLQEQVLKYPLVKDQFLGELKELDDEVLIRGRDSSGPIVLGLELLDPRSLAERYPIHTEPIRKRSRSIYPFDILNPGETRLIGPHSEQLLNRVRSAICTHRKKHAGTFKAVTDYENVLLHRCQEPSGGVHIGS